MDPSLDKVINAISRKIPYLSIIICSTIIIFGTFRMCGKISHIIDIIDNSIEEEYKHNEPFVGKWILEGSNLWEKMDIMTIEFDRYENYYISGGYYGGTYIFDKDANALILDADEDEAVYFKIRKIEEDNIYMNLIDEGIKVRCVLKRIID